MDMGTRTMTTEGVALVILLALSLGSVAWYWFRGPQTPSKRRQRVREYIESSREELGT